MNAGGPELNAETLALLRRALLDEALVSLRAEYCRTVTQQLSSVSSWLGLDSWLGADDVSDDPTSPVLAANDQSPPPRYASFRAVSAMVEIAAELGNGSIALLDAGLCYAAAALVRQLIEAEYLLQAFAQNFNRAAEWYRATPSEIRATFMPKTMRPLGGFSANEYWTHCDHGGHPSPQGVRLLRHGHHTPADYDALLMPGAWGDLGQHLKRVWSAVEVLLTAHHARFVAVRAAEIAAVREIETRWAVSDPFAQMLYLPEP